MDDTGLFYLLAQPPVSEHEDHLQFKIMTEGGEYQLLGYSLCDKLLTFSDEKASFFPLLCNNKTNIEKIILSRIKLGRFDDKPLPIVFPSREERIIDVPQGLTEIYCDGSCAKNGRGGWAFAHVDDVSITSKSGSEENSDSCRMELKAALMGITSLDKDEAVIFTDSRYVKRGVELWLKAWKQNGFITASGKEAKNRDLWEKIAAVLERKKIFWQWLKSGGGNPYHERCHNLAKDAALGIDY